MSELKIINIYAGQRPDGQAVGEDLRVKALENEELQLVNSPLFVKGLAAGDIFKYNEKERSITIVQRSGNLCIRVMAKQGLNNIADELTPRLEKLGGELELQNERILAYCIHISCGFSAIEKILNTYVGENTQSIWVYGNVYDPTDGVTPLKWWEEISND
jgi:hypothetical protein